MEMNKQLFIDFVLIGQVQADHCDVLISVTNVPELSLIDVTTNGLVVGAAVTLSELETVLMSEIISTVPS